MASTNDELGGAAGHAGPLLERDYWAVLEGCTLSAPEVAECLAEGFERFAPPDLCRFRRRGDRSGPLEVGEEMEVDIRLAGTFRVRVVHRDDHSVTLASVGGHPESGRITFGCYPNERGDLVVHIRSRAWSADRVRYAGFLALGEAMQTDTWTVFLDRLAAAVSDGILGGIQVEDRRVEATPEDTAGERAGPTFLARGER